MRLLTAIVFIGFGAVSGCSQAPGPAGAEVSGTSTEIAAPEAQPAAEPPAPPADKVDPQQQVAGIVDFSWARGPYRPEVYEGADHPDPHRAALEFTISNRGERDISAFKGRLNFLDVFGEEIYSTGFENDKTVKAGKSIKWTGSVQTLGDTQAESLYSADHTKVSIAIKLDQLIFVDGGKWSSATGMSDVQVNEAGAGS